MSFEILFPFGLWVFEPDWLLVHEGFFFFFGSTRGPLGAVGWRLVPRLGLGELKFPSTLKALMGQNVLVQIALTGGHSVVYTVGFATPGVH